MWKPHFVGHSCNLDEAYDKCNQNLSLSYQLFKAPNDYVYSRIKKSTDRMFESLQNFIWIAVFFVPHVGLVIIKIWNVCLLRLQAHISNLIIRLKSFRASLGLTNLSKINRKRKKFKKKRRKCKLLARTLTFTTMFAT